MGITSIYADDETNNVLKEIKGKNPEFNLSAFVKTCLLEKGGKSNVLDEPTILKNKRDAELKVENAKNEIEYWDNVHRDFKVQQELKKQEEEEKKIEEEKRKAIEGEAKKNIMETFKEEIKREMTELEYDNYNQNKDRYKTIWAFIDEIKNDLP